VVMSEVDGDLFEITVTFPAGANPAIEYKYQKNFCSVWEDAPNRLLQLPTDGTTTVVLDPDSWNNLPMGCGLGNVLDHQVEVCFQVCIQGVENTGDICVTGNLPELTGWGTGLAMTQIGTDLYQACIYFEAGQPTPVVIEYKFRKDGCETWESVGNRIVTVDTDSPEEITTTSAWEDGDSICDPVATESESWSAVKGMFR